jgi:hypothetical protein
LDYLDYLTRLSRLSYGVDMPLPTDYNERWLAILRPGYPDWDLWTVRYATQRRSAWCARPKGTPIATITVGSPEELIAAIAEAERIRSQGN